jgi:hypothetical protein
VQAKSHRARTIAACIVRQTTLFAPLAKHLGCVLFFVVSSRDSPPYRRILPESRAAHRVSRLPLVHARQVLNPIRYTKYLEDRLDKMEAWMQKVAQSISTRCLYSLSAASSRCRTFPTVRPQIQSVQLAARRLGSAPVRHGVSSPSSRYADYASGPSDVILDGRTRISPWRYS